MINYDSHFKNIKDKVVIPVSLTVKNKMFIVIIFTKDPSAPTKNIGVKYEMV